MCACDNRQLSEAAREAAFEQQRNAGALKAIRPFTGPATPENLVDYLNREVFPVLKQARSAVNEIYRQVTDNAPSGNPLGYFFSIATAGDPTVGRLALDNAIQENATTIRVSESNSLRRSIVPWLDVMAGSSTAPLGVVTLFVASDPSRFIRWDLDTMTDQGTYWDLGVAFVESSHENPFVDDDQVVLSFIPGVASTGTTVPVGSLTPIAAETFLGNFTGAVAPPAARAGILVAGGGLTYTAGGTLAVGAGTNVTVNADDIAVDNFPLSGLADQADDTFLANISGGVAPPTAVALTTLAGAGLTGGADAVLAVGAGTRITVNANDVQLAAGAAETFLGNFTSGSAVGDYRAGASVAGAGLTYTAGGTLAVGAGTNVTVNANDVAVTNFPLTGLATQADDTFLANISGGVAPPTAVALTTLAGSGLTGGADAVLAVGAGTGITVNANDVQLSTLIAESFFGNFTAGVAVGTARAGSSVAGGGLTYTAGGTLAVGAGTRITVNADDVQLAAGAAESFLMNATAGSAAADYRAGSSVAGAGLTYTAGGTLAVGAGTNVTVNANDVAVTNFPLTGLATQADDTFLANISGGAASPTAVALTTLAGAGLTGGADAILAVGAGTRITVNANDVQLAAGAAESFLMNATAGSAVADYRAGSSVAGNGLTYTAGGTLAVGAGTNVTVNANDVAVTNFPLTGLAAQAANTIVANATAGSAAPTALAISADSFPARLSGNLVNHSLATLAGDGLDYASGGIINVAVDNDRDIQIDASTGALFFRKSRRRHHWWEDFTHVPAQNITTAGAFLAFGQTGWFADATGATGIITAPLATDNHPGIVNIASGATSGNAISLNHGLIDLGGSVLAQDVYMVEAIIRIPTVTTLTWEFGLRDQPGDNYVEFYGTAPADTTTHTYTEEATVSTDTDTGTTFSAGAWNVYSIIQETTGTIDFYIDDVLEVTSSSNIPDGEEVYVFFEVTTATAAARSLDIDYVYFESKNLGARTS